MNLYRKIKSNPQIPEITFLIFVFFFFSAWALAQPFNAGPDEYMRYQIPEFIFKYGELPHGGDVRIRNEIWGISYGFFPILSYMISAAFMKVTSWFTMNPTALLMAARLVSVIFGTGTVYFLIRIGRCFFPKEGKWLFVCLAALLPEAVFITSYVNNDAMAVFSTAFIVYMWIYGIDNRWNKKSCIGLGIAMSFCVLSYYNAYGFLICSAILYTCTSLLNEKKPGKKVFKAWVYKGVFMLAVVFVLTGWWFVRNAIIYDGDMLGISTNNAYAEQYAQPKFKPSLNPTPYRQGEPLLSMIFGQWSDIVFKSFVGVFGYMNIFLSPKIYFCYKLLFAAGTLGCLLQIKRLFALKREGRWKSMAFFHWSLLGAMLISYALNIYHSYMVDFQPQGRYSLPMLVPLMYFTSTGILYLLRLLFPPQIRDSGRKYLLAILTTLVFSVSIYTFFRVIVPVYVLDVQSPVSEPGAQAETPVIPEK